MNIDRRKGCLQSVPRSPFGVEAEPYTFQTSVAIGARCASGEREPLNARTIFDTGSEIEIVSPTFVARNGLQKMVLRLETPTPVMGLGGVQTVVYETLTLDWQFKHGSPYRSIRCFLVDVGNDQFDVLVGGRFLSKYQLLVAQDPREEVVQSCHVPNVRMAWISSLARMKRVTAAEVSGVNEEYERLGRVEDERTIGKRRAKDPPLYSSRSPSPNPVAQPHTPGVVSILDSGILGVPVSADAIAGDLLKPPNNIRDQDVYAQSRVYLKPEPQVIQARACPPWHGLELNIPQDNSWRRSEETKPMKSNEEINLVPSGHPQSDVIKAVENSTKLTCKSHHRHDSGSCEKSPVYMLETVPSRTDAITPFVYQPHAYSLLPQGDGITTDFVPKALAKPSTWSRFQESWRTDKQERLSIGPDSHLIKSPASASTTWTGTTKFEGSPHVANSEFGGPKRTKTEKFFASKKWKTARNVFIVSNPRSMRLSHPVTYSINC